MATYTQIRSWPLLLMIVSTHIDVLPVCRSPMISSRWPRPTFVIESIGLMPVSIGSFTGWRDTTPGALNSAGRVLLVFTSPLPSSGRPSGSTMRPSSSSPTGTSSRRPVRLTWSPSSIWSHSPNSTAPTLSDSRLSARPVTSWGSSSSSIDMTLSSPCTREMPSATDSTVPTSDRSAPPSSRPWMRSLRMLVISSGLICMSLLIMSVRTRPSRVLRLGSGSRHLLAKLFESVAHRGVEHHVADPHLQAAQHVRVHLRGQLHAPAGLLLDAPAYVLHEALVEVDRARHGHRQQLVLLGPHTVEDAADPEQRRHAVALREKLEEVQETLVGVAYDSPHAVLLLVAREVRREQEHLELAALVEGVGELAELVVHPVEDVAVPGGLEQRAGVDLSDLFHCPPARPAPRSRPRAGLPRSGAGGRPE